MKFYFMGQKITGNSLFRTLLSNKKMIQEH